MTKPIIRIHNAETNEVIDREMTAAEFAQFEIDKAAEITRHFTLRYNGVPNKPPPITVKSKENRFK